MSTTTGQLGDGASASQAAPIRYSAKLTGRGVMLPLFDSHVPVNCVNAHPAVADMLAMQMGQNPIGIGIAYWQGDDAKFYVFVSSLTERHSARKVAEQFGDKVMGGDRLALIACEMPFWGEKAHDSGLAEVTLKMEAK